MKGLVSSMIHDYTGNPATGAGDMHGNSNLSNNILANFMYRVPIKTI